jgi:acyl-CoA synthetase (NDP forming)
VDVERHRQLTRLLAPESVAVVGASPNSRYGMRILGNLRRRDWAGRLYGVNPRYQDVDGVPCYPSLGALPERVDLVVVATSAPAVAGVLEEANRAGAGGAIILAADVAETARPRIAEMSQGSGLAVLGPNCLGYVGLGGGLTGAWSIGLPDRPWIGPGAAVVSQSGNLANHLVNCYVGQSFSHVISSGNHWGVSSVEFLEWLLPREEVRVLGAIIEGMPDPDGFTAVAEQARRIKKPLCILHLGRSTLGRAMAAAHTGALAAGDEWWKAVRRRVPFAEATDLEEFVAILKLLQRIGEPPRLRVGLAASSGGECGLMADLAQTLGVELADLTDASRERLQESLPEYVHPQNPLDYGASTWGTEEPYTSVVTGLAADPHVDLAGAVQDFPGSPSHVSAWETMMDGAARAHHATGKPVLVMTTMGGVPDAYYDRAEELGVHVFAGLRSTMAALGEVGRLGREAASWPGPRKHHGALGGQALGAGPWDEYQAKQALASWGLAAPRGALSASFDTLPAVAAAVGYPAVLKAVGVLHKSDVGAVEVNLRSPQELMAAATRMVDRMAGHGLSPAGFLVEQYLAGRLEWFVGGSTRGGVLVTGPGGVDVEIWRDTAPVLLGATAEEVRDALLETRAGRILAGFRGRPGYDVDALVSAIVAVSDFLLCHRQRVLTIDVNPLLVGRPGEGVAAADVLLLEEVPAGAGGEKGALDGVR